MHACLVALVLCLATRQQAEAAYFQVPIEELQLESGGRLPSYGGPVPWEQFGSGVEVLPRAALEGEGEAVLRIHDPRWNSSGDDLPRGSLGNLCVRTAVARDLAGTLYLPKASGGGFLRLWFKCSGQYARANKTADGAAYVGRCPKCGAAARFPIGPGGTNVRVFEMSCR